MLGRTMGDKTPPAWPISCSWAARVTLDDDDDGDDDGDGDNGEDDQDTSIMSGAAILG